VTDYVYAFESFGLKRINAALRGKKTAALALGLVPSRDGWLSVLQGRPSDRLHIGSASFGL